MDGAFETGSGWLLSDVETLTRFAGPVVEPGPREVVVTPTVIGLCGSDTAAYSGNHPRMKPPIVLGHEFAGTVAAIGDDVDGWSVGDRAAIDPILTCGSCEACTSGRRSACSQYQVIGCNQRWPGALGGAVRVPVSQLVGLDDRIDDTAAALLQPLAISHHAVTVRGRVGKGDRILVVGAGPIGLGCALIAEASGAEVWIADVREDRLEVAVAGSPFRPALVDLETGLPAELRGTFEIALEAAGGRHAGPIGVAQSAVARGGRIVGVGNFAAGTVGIDLSDFKDRELEFVGAQGYGYSFGLVKDLVAIGSIRTDTLVSHRLGIDDVPEAFELLTAGEPGTMKIMVSAV